MCPKNNLFSLAYSELSQDAFFAWLFNFANPVYQNNHQQLHQCATELLQKWLDYPITISTIKIETQHTFFSPTKDKNKKKKRNAIDILITINDDTHIIIESKTNSHLHSNQLTRYSNYAKEKFLNFVGIYLKTGNESKLHQKDIHSFKAVNRQDLLHHFNNHKDKIKNDIFIDFVEYLQDLENRTKQFEKLELQDWKWHQWQGFYLYLENLGLLSWWGAVNNPHGSFLAADFDKKQWQSNHGQSYEIVFGIHQKQLVFGIFDQAEKSANARNEFSKHLLRHAKDKFPEIKKPKFGKGKFMKVAYINDYWLENGEYIGLDRLVDKLITYQNFLLSL